tara:strand:- start:2189 stop:2464 length:276 start_codon:yes stop_codon:yes gene_type:complete
MKNIIKKVLDRHKDSQGNLGSDSFRDMLAVEIAANLDKGLAKDNPLSIEMWKGYQESFKDVTGEQLELNFEETIEYETRKDMFMDNPIRNK